MMGKMIEGMDGVRGVGVIGYTVVTGAVQILERVQGSLVMLKIWGIAV